MYLDISYERTCDCKKSHLSCVSAKQWVKNQIGVWQFGYEKRDIRDKNIHPATFPISLASRVIEQFTHKGELVLDCFCGSGTTLLASQDLDRNAVGFDLKQEYVDLANSRLDSSLCNTKQMAVCADARNIADYIEPKTVKLLFTSPPYANMLNTPRKNKSARTDKRKDEHYGEVQQYSKDDRDLGVLTPDLFLSELGNIFSAMRGVFDDKAHIVVNISDFWRKEEHTPLHIGIINTLSESGYVFRNTIIWDRRNLVNGTGIFGYPSNYITMRTSFEYILDFTVRQES